MLQPATTPIWPVRASSSLAVLFRVNFSGKENKMNRYCPCGSMARSQSQYRAVGATSTNFAGECDTSGAPKNPCADLKYNNSQSKTQNYGPGAGAESGTESANRVSSSKCGPKPCGREYCPSLGSRSLPEDRMQRVQLPPEETPPTHPTPPPHLPLNSDSDSDIGNAAISLGKGVALFCAGIYLTKSLATVALELG